MRVFFAPKVILVARPSLIMAGVAELLEEFGEEATWRRADFDTDGDGLPELMGRLCYASFGKKQGRVGATDYIGHILDAGHGSVLEHANWSFVACRASRGFTHQMVRHRAGFAYSQESSHFNRYDEEADVCLTGLADSPVAAEQACLASLKAYEQLWADLRATFDKDAKVKKIVCGTARGLLPTALQSRLGFTGNARALRHFCQTRGNPDNTLEIREVAVQVAKIMKVEAPAAFQDVEISSTDDGWERVEMKHVKV